MMQNNLDVLSQITSNSTYTRLVAAETVDFAWIPYMFVVEKNFLIKQLLHDRLKNGR